VHGGGGLSGGIVLGNHVLRNGGGPNHGFPVKNAEPEKNSQTANEEENVLRGD